MVPGRFIESRDTAPGTASAPPPIVDPSDGTGVTTVPSRCATTDADAVIAAVTARFPASDPTAVDTADSTPRTHRCPASAAVTVDAAASTPNTHRFPMSAAVTPAAAAS